MICGEWLYFMGIDTVTQSYIIWMIDRHEERISAHVEFDENCIIRQEGTSPALKFSSESKSVDDYTYLIGMVTL